MTSLHAHAKMSLRQILGTPLAFASVVLRTDVKLVTLGSVPSVLRYVHILPVRTNNHVRLEAMSSFRRRMSKYALCQMTSSRIRAVVPRSYIVRQTFSWMSFFRRRMSKYSLCQMTSSRIRAVVPRSCIVRQTFSCPMSLFRRRMSNNAPPFQMTSLRVSELSFIIVR